MDTPASPEAIAAALEMATAYFKNRKGHGGAPASNVVLYPAKLGALLALAYQRGYDEALKRGR